MHSSRSEFFELSDDLLAIADHNGKLLDFNSKWQRVLGWSAVQLQKDFLDSKIFKADLEKFKSMLEDAKTTREESNCEFRIRHCDTSPRVLTCKAMLTPAGDAFFLVAQDRTTALATRQILETANRQIQGMFSSLIESVIVQNVAGRILQSNQAALNLFGVGPSEVIGWFSFDEKWEAAFENGRPVTIDSHPAMLAQKTGQAQTNCLLQIRRPSGERRWVSVSAIPLFEADNPKPNQVVITLHDMTDERESQRALANKEREVSSLMNRLPARVAYWDSNLKNVFSNNAVADVFGKAPADIVGLHAREVFGDEMYERNLPYAKKALEGVHQAFESSYLTSSGELRHVLASYIPNTQEGKTLGFYSVITDVSKLKNLEFERREFEAKFVAASKMSALGEMAAGIAHEINNPLAIINGRTDLLRSRMEKGQFDAERIQSDLNAISDTVERIAKTVRGLLAFSRNQDDDQMRSVPIHRIVVETIDLCREKIRNRGIQLHVEVDSEIQIDCRENQISQILMNLLNNACDAIENHKNPWIRIAADVENGSLALRVVDSGAGIPLEVVEKIMNPFFTTKEIGKGTGLGLSISKGLAESHGGQLSFDTAEPHTCFLLQVPLSGTKARASATRTQLTG
jgi:PAS domain S-box-containing protein